LTSPPDQAQIKPLGAPRQRISTTFETQPMTYVDPQVDRWVFTYLHGISARTVKGAPTFAEVLPVLRDALAGQTVYQHSGFDRSAVAAACGNSGLNIPQWEWCDSVHVARAAWPELRGNGGHGLASLKQHLGLEFDHHDAGEDARAAAKVVLRAEGRQPVRLQNPVRPSRAEIDDDFDLIEDDHYPVTVAEAPFVALTVPVLHALQNTARAIGTTEITQGNIDNDHIYLRGFFDKFPADAIGGSNRASAAQRDIAVDRGGGTVVMTDLDGAKRFFRKRGWIREFFARQGAQAGDLVIVEEIAPYSYRLVLQRQSS
jgi:DNA polymerase III epsilon subunit-like protein